MVPPLIAASALLAALPGPDRPSPEDVAAYRAQAAEPRRDADAQVRLALWCEARGMQSERLKHLALAILADPRHPRARGLMGQVADDGCWRRPEAVAARARADPGLSRAMAEYAARRDRTPETADAQRALALWCEGRGLGPEAMAHATAASRLDADRLASFASPEAGTALVLPVSTEAPRPSRLPGLAAGTTVRTRLGPRPIESIRVGDRLLTQDPRTGALGFSPVLRTALAPPSPALRLVIGDEAIVASPALRVWKAGHGWVPARDLQAGDPIRILGGLGRIASVRPEPPRAVVALEVHGQQDFMAGGSGALAHDGTPAPPVPEPFDARSRGE